MVKKQEPGLRGQPRALAELALREIHAGAGRPRGSLTTARGPRRGGKGPRGAKAVCDDLG